MNIEDGCLPKAALVNNMVTEYFNSGAFLSEKYMYTHTHTLISHNIITTGELSNMDCLFTVVPVIMY